MPLNKNDLCTVKEELKKNTRIPSVKHFTRLWFEFCSNSIQLSLHVKDSSRCYIPVFIHSCTCCCDAMCIGHTIRCWQESSRDRYLKRLNIEILKSLSCSVSQKHRLITPRIWRKSFVHCTCYRASVYVDKTTCLVFIFTITARCKNAICDHCSIYLEHPPLNRSYARQ